MPEVLKGPIIRIESDGTPFDTKVTHIESGVDLTPCVRSVTWKVGANELPTVSLEIVGQLVTVDLKGELTALSEAILTTDENALPDLWERPHYGNIEAWIEHFDSDEDWKSLLRSVDDYRTWKRKEKEGVTGTMGHACEGAIGIFVDNQQVKDDMENQERLLAARWKEK